MTEPNQTTDAAGIQRTETGQIDNPTAQPAAATQESNQTTNPSESPSLLNQTSETKPAEPAKSPEQKGEGGAPEKYEDYKVPEGFTLDPAIKTEIDGLFKGLNLTQAQGQSLVDWYVKQTNASAEAPYQAWDAMKQEWRQAAESHPELRGKLGPNQEVNVRIGKFLNQLPDQQLASDFRQLMDLTGAGDHPAFIRVIDYAAKKLTEGGHVIGNGPAADGQSRGGQSRQPTAAEAMWPNLAQQR